MSERIEKHFQKIRAQAKNSLQLTSELTSLTPLIGHLLNAEQIVTCIQWYRRRRSSEIHPDRSSSGEKAELEAILKMGKNAALVDLCVNDLTVNIGASCLEVVEAIASARKRQNQIKKIQKRFVTGCEGTTRASSLLFNSDYVAKLKSFKKGGGKTETIDVIQGRVSVGQKIRAVVGLLKVNKGDLFRKLTTPSSRSVGVYLKQSEVSSLFARLKAVSPPMRSGSDFVLVTVTRTKQGNLFFVEGQVLSIE